MVQESKNIADKYDGFIGISALGNLNMENGGSGDLRHRQYLTVQKINQGKETLVPVTQVFHYQRFESAGMIATDSL
jgi:hypothetical protein